MRSKNDLTRFVGPEQPFVGEGAVSRPALR
jgi:hypothetical protein